LATLGGFVYSEKQFGQHRGTIVSTSLLYWRPAVDTTMPYDDTIMASLPPIENHLRFRRTHLGWSQDELARPSGLSRTAISAIETERNIPCATAVLTLAAALDCRVEDLFRLRRPEPQEPHWAWPPGQAQCRYWKAEAGGVERLYPATASPMGLLPHDGIYRNGSCLGQARWDPRRTLVMACCDPAVGLLAAELANTAEVRLIALHRPHRLSRGVRVTLRWARARALTPIPSRR
jgi:DNA-binding XRE family transcriptional regulator